MASVFCDFSIFQKINHICRNSGRNAMGDIDQRFPFGKGIKALEGSSMMSISLS